MGFAITLDGAAHEVEIVALRPRLKLRIDGREYSVTGEEGEEDGRRRIEIDGQPVRFARVHVEGRQILRMDGGTFEAILVDPRDAAEAAGGSHDHVRAPMPGAVVQVHKRAGEAVARGETLLTIESMKLQMALAAPRDGVIAEVKRSVGETFDKDEVVVVLEPLRQAGD
jgi:biotin carboxyl carrier protein